MDIVGRDYVLRSIDAIKVHEYFDSGVHIGKIVLAN